MGRSPRKTARKDRRQTRRQTQSKPKSKSNAKSKTRSVSVAKYNSTRKCIKLFKRYRLTDTTKLRKWMNNNHPDKVTNQSSKVEDDFKFITGCWANRKDIFKHVKSKTKSKSKSKKKKKVKEIKGDQL